ncbi:retrovirus-related pol polyprotein from transposon TNT 1-94 [Tanacetum coccineum]
MANLSEDIQCAGSDTRPPMLDKADFASWQQRIRLYCRGTEGPINLGPERPRVYSELSQEEKDRYNADIRATNIVLQGLPKDIYSLINHYTDAKDIWDNVKMFWKRFRITKEDRESQLYDEFEHFLQNKGETIHSYYVRFAKLINDMRNIKMTMSKIQLNSKFVIIMLPNGVDYVTATVDPLALMSNVSPQQYHSQSSTNPPTTYHQPHSADTSQSDLGISPTENLIENLTNTLALLTQSYKTFLPQTNNQLRTSSNPRIKATVQRRQGILFRMFRVETEQRQGNMHGGAVHGLWEEHKTGGKSNRNSEYFKDKMLLMQAQENEVILDEEQSLFLAADDCDAYDSDVDDAPTAQTLFMANLSSVDPVYNEAGPSYDSDVLSEVQAHDHYQDAVYDHHEEHEMHDDYVKDNAVPVVQNNASMVPNDAYVMIDNDLHDSDVRSVSHTPRNTVANNLLNAELATYKEQVELYERRARQVQPALYSGHGKKMHDKMKAKACVDNKVNITPPNYSKENFLATFSPQKQLTPEQLFWSQDIVKMKAEALKEQNTRPIKALTVYPPNTPATLVPRVLPTKSQVKINIFTLRTTVFEFDKTSLTKEVKEMSDAFDELEAELDQSIVDRKHDAIERKNLLLEHDNIIADCLLKEVFYVASNSELNASRFTEMQKAHNVVKTRCLELEAELSNLRNDVRKDNYNDLLNRFSNLEVNHLNLQLKYQNLKDSFQNKPSSSVNDTPDFNSVFVIGQMKASLQGKDNVIQKLKMQISQCQETKLKMQISQFQETRSELDRPLDLRARDSQISQLTKKIKNENESLKVQIQNTVSCVTTTQFKPKVTAPGKYALDVEPIPPRNRNNREVHLVYLRHLKESVDTLREIVEEAKVKRPLDRSLAFACRYTKHSQELLEYVFGTCPKVFNQQDKKHATTPRKKQVTFEDQIATSSSTTYKHVEPMHTQKSNVPVPPSTGVNSCTDASGSQPRSILKKHRIPPAKSDSLKKVEDHPRTIRSSLKTTNRVDSSISSKRTIINSNSHSVCQTCNKCLFSANHDMCVVTYLHSVNASPNVKNDVRHVKQVWKPKQVTQVWKPKHIKQIWKPTGKTLNNVGYQWRPTGRTFTLSDQCPLTRFTKLTGMSAIACANQSEPKQHWGSNFPNSPSSSVFKCRSYKSSFVRFGNDHFGAIMGYGDYVIGDSVISRVYYVEGLGHNLFSVGQFCDSDLEVAFRKHSCYVRDTDGVELLKGSRGSNLYTISVEDMMRSSPICLLSKASKNKSWLWHRRLNHLNFGTINDLARKDLVRGLPRLKFEKDHLCSACQLGKSKKHTHKPKAENTNLEVLNTLHMDLCGPMRVQTINGKKYILVIVDDYSRFTWVKFLRSKDETPAVVIKFLKQIQVGLNNGTEFVNKTLYDHYEKVGIFHQKTVPRTPQQNGVVERRNRTLVEAARTMLIFSKAPMFLWAEAVATACYTQNRSLIHTRHDKTPYELVHNKKPDLTFFRVFGALCYPTNDSEDLGKLQPTADHFHAYDCSIVASDDLRDALSAIFGLSELKVSS